MEPEDVPEQPKRRDAEDTLTRAVIGCALTVHRELGPGLLETAYEQCLAHELTLAGITFQLQCPLPLAYKGIRLDCGYRVDFLIEKQLIVELKSVEELLPVHDAQLLTYLRLAHLHTGLLINFNVPRLKQGLKRLSL